MNETGTSLRGNSSQLVREIVSRHKRIMDAMRNSVADAIRIGELLTEAKASLGHGEWLPWMEKHLPFSQMTASRYVRVFEKRDQLKLNNVFNLSDAYKLLSPPPETPSRREQPGGSKPLDVLDAFDLASLVAHVFKSQGRQLGSSEALGLILGFTQPSQPLEFNEAGEVVAS
jgi:hypothetical protein